MEKGEIRFHGPTAELLERPDVLRSVFLEGAGDGRARRRTGPAIVHVSEAAVTQVAATAAPAGNGSHGDPRLERATACRSASVASARSPTCRSTSPRRDRRLHRPERRGQDDAVRRDLRLHSPPTTGTIVARRRRRRARHHAAAARGARAPRARPLVPGRPAVPGAHRRRRRSRSRSSAASTCATRSRAALHLPSVADAEADVDAARRGAARAARHRRLPRQVRPRALDRQPAHRRPRVRARARARRCCCSTSRRRASRSARPRRSGRCCCASATQTGASLLVIEHDVPLLSSIADRMIALDLGEVVATGTPQEVIRDPSVVASYLGESEAVVARSGPRLE